MKSAWSKEMPKPWPWQRFFPPEADVRLILCRSGGGINVLVNGTNNGDDYLWGITHDELLHKSQAVAYPLWVNTAWYTHHDPDTWVTYFTRRTKGGSL